MSIASAWSKYDTACTIYGIECGDDSTCYDASIVDCVDNFCDLACEDPADNFGSHDYICGSGEVNAADVDKPINS